MRRHFGVQWTESEHYDLVMNTKRVSVEECVAEVLSLAAGPQFVETQASHQKLDDLVVDHGQPELFPEPAGYILAERAHLARDGNDRHLKSLPGKLQPYSSSSVRPLP